MFSRQAPLILAMSRSSTVNRERPGPRGRSRAPIQQMKAYLAVTGTVFGLLALAHLFRTISEWQRLVAEPSLVVEVPGIGLLAAALSFWAWRLLWVMKRRARLPVPP